MEIATTLFPNQTRAFAARELAREINQSVSLELQRSDRTVEAYCQGQRRIPMEYAATVMGFLKNKDKDFYDEVEPRISSDSVMHSAPASQTIDLENTLKRMEKTIDKMQAASQSTSMLMAIRSMCEDCAGGPASEPENVCWWKNCPLRPFSDMKLDEKAKKI